MPVRDIVLAIVVMMIWGVSFSVVKIGLIELPPLLFIATRFLIVAIPAVFFVPFPKTSAWNVIAVGLLLGVIKFGLLFIATKEHANAGIASLALQSQVFFTIALSYFFFKETVSRREFAGITVAVIGFLFFFASASGNVTVTGLLLIGLAGLAWSASNIVMKTIPQVNLLHFMVWVSLIPPVPLLLLSYATETRQPVQLLLDVSLSSWLSIVYMGYLATLVAYAAWGWLLGRHSASTVTPFALLIPVFGIITSAIWLGETLTSQEMLGTLLIMIGLFVCIFPGRLIKARFNIGQ